MGLKRQLPQSNTSRSSALNKALDKYNSPPPYGTVLTGATHTRLVNITGSYNAGRQQVGIKQAAQVGQTNTKNTAQLTAKRTISHFLQGFNNGVERGVFQASERPYFGIAETSGAVPPMDSEKDLTDVGKAVIDGEIQRIADGLVAVPFPNLAEVQAAYNAFTAANLTQSTKKDASGQASHGVDILNTEADAVIKKVWDEVETFFNEEHIESRRNYLREWGVVYVSDDGPLLVLGRAINSVTHEGIPGATISIGETAEEISADPDGNFALPTHGTGNLTLHIVAPDYTEKLEAITIPPTGDLNVGDVGVVHV